MLTFTAWWVPGPKYFLPRQARERPHGAGAREEVQEARRHRRDAPGRCPHELPPLLARQTRGAHLHNLSNNIVIEMFGFFLSGYLHF